MLTTVTADQLPLVAGFYHAMMAELGMLHDPLVENWHDLFVAHHAGELRRGDAAWFLAVEGGTPAGCAGALRDTSPSSKWTTARSGIIVGVYVKPEFRRRGHARALTLASLEWFKAQGVNRIRLQASPYARPLYESLGFKPGIEMRLNLD